MPQKLTVKSTHGKQSASKGQQMARGVKSSTSSKMSTKMSPKSQAKKEQASKAADAGAAPEQLDSELE